MSTFTILTSALIKNLNKAGIFEHSSHFLFVKNINENSCLIDLGANTGMFYSLMTNRYNCFCHAVEASPQLFSALPVSQKVNHYNFAICDHNGPVTFYLSENPEANSMNAPVAEKWKSQGSVTVQGKTFENFLAENKIRLPIDIIKIDIEGAELDVLENLSHEILTTTGQIAVEFHDFLITDLNYLTRMYKTIDKLRKHYHVIKISNTDWREILFINPIYNRLSLSQRIRLSLIHPFLMSLKTIHSNLSKILTNVPEQDN